MRKRKQQNTNHNEEADSEADNSDSTYKKWKQAWRQTTIANKATVIASVIVACATLVYATVACFQLIAINEGNRFSRDALASVQRAFITYRTMT
jgi:hypothetical protein